MSINQPARARRTKRAPNVTAVAISATPTQAVVPSLPPAPGATTLSLSPVQLSDARPKPAKVPASNKIEGKSLIRRKALAIVAMRAQGYTSEEIAAELKVRVATLSTYVYRAVKSGFLVNSKGESLLADPKDQVEYELAHKVVRNLGVLLDCGDTKIQKEVTLEVAKGTLFKKFDQQVNVPLPNMNVLSLRIEMPRGAEAITVREGSIGGKPAYLEGERLDE